MKLQILVPHYNETEEEIKPLLDSIAIQQQADFSEVGVIIAHDGKDIPRLSFYCEDGYDGIDEDYYYPFKIEQIWNEHEGVSATRNLALDHATA